MRSRFAALANPEVSHYRSYEITAVEAYMDLYQITGEQKYLDAVDGFVWLFRRHWLHVGGSVAIKEWRLYPPGSYFLDTDVSLPACQCSPSSPL